MRPRRRGARGWTASTRRWPPFRRPSQPAAAVTKAADTLHKIRPLSTCHGVSTWSASTADRAEPAEAHFRTICTLERPRQSIKPEQRCRQPPYRTECLAHRRATLSELRGRGVARRSTRTTGSIQQHSAESAMTSLTGSTSGTPLDVRCLPPCQQRH